jgi:hypothetical protein
MVFAIRWDIIIEVSLLVLVLAGAIVVSSILIIRRLQKEFKDLYRQQSKFDIELRKSANLISKVIKNEEFEKYENSIIKELAFIDKKALLDLIDTTYQLIDIEDETNQYVKETYENLHETRRQLDSKVLGYNQLISMFPFNFYAGILKMKKMPHYTHNE